MRGVRRRQDSAFGDQTEGWWSRVSKEVICGDAGEEGARFPGTSNALGRNVGVFISLVGSHQRILSRGGTGPNLYLKLTPLAVGGEQTVGEMV